MCGLSVGVTYPWVFMVAASAHSDFNCDTVLREKQHSGYKGPPNKPSDFESLETSDVPFDIQSDHVSTSLAHA